MTKESTREDPFALRMRELTASVPTGREMRPPSLAV